MAYKIYIEGNTLLMEDNGSTPTIVYEGNAKDCLLTRVYDNSTDFSFKNLNGWDSSELIEFSEVDLIGADYTDLATFIIWCRDSLGKSSGGASSIPTQDIFHGGFVDYNDLATTSAPIPFTSSGYIVLTNDKLGAFTNENYLPDGITSIYSVNQFNFTQLKLGDMIDIRLDLTVSTSGSNQEIKVDLALGIGVSEYLVPFEDISEKKTGVHLINSFNGIYMGDTLTLDNPAEFRLSSNRSGTVIVNGWYCKIIRKG